MNFIEITDFSILFTKINFTLNYNLDLSNSNIFIYINDILIPSSDFVLSKDSQNNSYVVNLLNNLKYDKIIFYISKDNMQSNICTSFHNLKMINYENFSFSELNFAFPSSIFSDNYDFYALKFVDEPVLSNKLTFSICNGINSTSSYIKQIYDSSDLDNYTFEIMLFDKNNLPIPSSNYIIESYY